MSFRAYYRLGALHAHLEGMACQRLVERAFGDCVVVHDARALVAMLQPCQLMAQRGSPSVGSLPSPSESIQISVIASTAISAVLFVCVDNDVSKA